jgi:Protein of unknown function (DUF2867)
MRPIDPREFLAQPLRVHSFLRGVPLHDVWATDLPGAQAGITLREFFRRRSRQGLLTKVYWPARALFGLRIFLGRIFGWDKQPHGAGQPSFAERLTPSDREQSAVPAGTAEGIFRVVYSFENEILHEASNRTVHAATLLALTRPEGSYRLYFAIYVSKVSWFTPVYMALIGPFRRWIVYPAILRQIQQSWNRAFGVVPPSGA